MFNPRRPRWRGALATGALLAAGTGVAAPARIDDTLTSRPNGRPTSLETCGAVHAHGTSWDAPAASAVLDAVWN